MSEPYTASLITKLLRDMPAERLAAAHPHDFHRWPVRKIVASKVINELISNELARRAR